MSFLSDLKVLYHLAIRPVRGSSHAERMENFYSGQAKAYDDFRKRLLHGREELYRKMGEGKSGAWVDMGGGTGANLEFIGPAIQQYSKVYVVDLASSLLKISDLRAQERGWKQVQSVTADATQWEPEEPVDIITFSYSLTMIPDWFAAIDNAYRILKPGGHIGVVDFYVGRKHPNSGMKKHGWFTRNFWPVWFSSDNVFPNHDHIPYLQGKFETVWLSENRSKVPYIPFIRTPFYQFIGRKPLA